MRVNQHAQRVQSYSAMSTYNLYKSCIQAVDNNRNSLRLQALAFLRFFCFFMDMDIQPSELKTIEAAARALLAAIESLSKPIVV